MEGTQQHAVETTSPGVIALQLDVENLHYGDTGFIRLNS